MFMLVLMELQVRLVRSLIYSNVPVYFALNLLKVNYDFLYSK
jgi:hypothetical protein